jgi:hypothetical protein
MKTISTNLMGNVYSVCSMYIQYTVQYAYQPVADLWIVFVRKKT